MKCPVCRATYRPPEVPEAATSTSQSPSPNHQPCRRCGADLSPLIHLHDQAIWYHRQAIQAFKAGDYTAATTWNNQALSLYSINADFHAFAGQLWALQGDFRQAIACWKQAQQLEPRHPTAAAGLELLRATG